MLRRLLVILFWSLSYITFKIGSTIKSHLNSLLTRAMVAARLYAVASRLYSLESPSFILLRDENAELERGLGQVNEKLSKIMDELGLLKEENVELKKKLAQTETQPAGSILSTESVKDTTNECHSGSSSVVLYTGSNRNELEEEARLRLQDPNCLGIFARLENSYLESCIFPKSTSVSGEVIDSKNQSTGDHRTGDDSADDSVIIITDSTTPTASMNQESVAMLAPIVTFTDSSACGARDPIFCPSRSDTKPHQKSSDNTLPATNPIPVHITTRPSLPPKVSNSTRSLGSTPSKNAGSSTGKLRLKPLLLAARFTTAASVSVRRKLAAKKSNTNLKCNESSDKKHIEDKTQEIEEKCVALTPEMKADPQMAKENAKLNPYAPAFTPGTFVPHHANNQPIITVGDVGTGTLPKVNNPNSVAQVTFSKQGHHTTLSPSLSPFLCISPSPNSPFVRPAPYRRQSGDGFTRTSAAVPICPPSEKQKQDSNSKKSGKGYEKKEKAETRASSLSLIRERAAKREAALSSVTMRSPALTKTDSTKDINGLVDKSSDSVEAATLILPSSSSGLGLDLQSVAATKKDALITTTASSMQSRVRPRLEGKGLPSVPLRRTFEELTNSPLKVVVDGTVKVNPEDVRQGGAECISRELGSLQSVESISRMNRWASH